MENTSWFESEKNVVSDEEDEGVALWHVDGIGTEVLELALHTLHVLEIDGGSSANVFAVDVVLTVGVVEVHAGVLSVVLIQGGILDGGGGAGVVGAHFVFLF